MPGDHQGRESLLLLGSERQLLYADSGPHFPPQHRRARPAARAPFVYDFIRAPHEPSDILGTIALVHPPPTFLFVIWASREPSHGRPLFSPHSGPSAALRVASGIFELPANRLTAPPPIFFYQFFRLPRVFQFGISSSREPWRARDFRSFIRASRGLRRCLLWERSRSSVNRRLISMFPTHFQQSWAKKNRSSACRIFLFRPTAARGLLNSKGFIFIVLAVNRCTAT
ncbi:hypothetical protein B0H10DRAFT_893387 [Mycena sp. CBHHK59/15]|nr:hypothetical protein B0H10DRAFT_893387 [Mycena sp. CBHHK59/15]